MIRRISPQRHGQSEPLIREDKQSSFTAINEISGGAADIIFDQIAASVNIFASSDKFGRMFSNARPFRPDTDKELIAIAQSMLETNGDVENADHPNLPAGFTYFVYNPTQNQIWRLPRGFNREFCQDFNRRLIVL